MNTCTACPPVRPRDRELSTARTVPRSPTLLHGPATVDPLCGKRTDKYLCTAHCTGRDPWRVELREGEPMGISGSSKLAQGGWMGRAQCRTEFSHMMETPSRSWNFCLEPSAWNTFIHRQPSLRPDLKKQEGQRGHRIGCELTGGDMPLPSLRKRAARDEAHTAEAGPASLRSLAWTGRNPESFLMG